MQIQENTISMFSHGTSSLSSPPGFRKMCWASAACSKHLACCLVCAVTHSLLGGALSTILSYWQKEERLLKRVPCIRVLTRPSSLLSLLEDAFCCVLESSSSSWSSNSSWLPPLCAKLLVFEGCSAVPVLQDCVLCCPVYLTELVTLIGRAAQLLLRSDL